MSTRSATTRTRRVLTTSVQGFKSRTAAITIALRQLFSVAKLVYANDGPLDFPNGVTVGKKDIKSYLSTIAELIDDLPKYHRASVMEASKSRRPQGEARGITYVSDQIITWLQNEKWVPYSDEQIADARGIFDLAESRR